MNRSAISDLIRQVVWVVRRTLLQWSFGLWQFLGFHVTANHYYEPIPDTRRLPSSLWSPPFESSGVEMQDTRQVELLREFVESFRGEYTEIPLGPQRANGKYYINNGSFESVDGELLYCMIRHFRPKRIIEVGSGYSTLLASRAIERNAADGGRCEFTSIDPFPPKRLLEGVEGLSQLIAQPVEAVPTNTFRALGSNDVLFIDSSHVLKIGSDVQYELLEVLPRLRVGVLIHFHDIFLPAEYPKDWVLKYKRFWSEQYLLQAFLAFNRAFEVVWGSSYMHLTHPDMLAAAFPSYRQRPRWPGSFWIRKIL